MLEKFEISFTVKSLTFTINFSLDKKKHLSNDTRALASRHPARATTEKYKCDLVP